jgi:tRNA(Arg) A34 adenosine deaminase TadA
MKPPRLSALAFIAIATAQGVVRAAAPAVTPLPDDPACNEADLKFMHRAHELAAAAVAHGNTAYGALLVKDGQVLMEFENDAITSRDVTHHAETGIISKASVQLGPAVLAQCTLITSTEPCIMCCGAVRTAGIKRLVYGVTGVQSHRLRGRTPAADQLQVREVFRRVGAGEIVILGPLLEAEGLAVHARANATVAARTAKRE